MAEVSIEQLERLGHESLVAYACRAARRVQPLCLGGTERVAAVDAAISLAESFAYNDDGPAAHRVVRAAANAAFAAAQAVAEAARGNRLDAAFQASEAAAQAAQAAHSAADNAIEFSFAELNYTRAHLSTSVANDAIAAAAKAAAEAAAARDFSLLETMRRPIDLDELGPLWPDGEPAWFTEAIATTSLDASGGQPPLRCFVDPGDAPAELLAQLYADLDAVYVAHGGSGLRIVRDRLGSVVGDEVEQ